MMQNDADYHNPSLATTTRALALIKLLRVPPEHDDPV